MVRVVGKALAGWIVAAALVVFAVPAWAADEALARFVGDWTGTGVSEKFSAEGYFTYKKRDLNVQFSMSEGGFDLTWTTGFRVTGDDGETAIARKTTTLAFKEVASGLYETEAAPPWLRAHRWARLSGDTLAVYIFEVDSQGIYEISRYVRRVDEKGVMHLGFSRDMDGRPVRQVTGTLTKAGE